MWTGLGRSTCLLLTRSEPDSVSVLTSGEVWVFLVGCVASGADPSVERHLPSEVL